MRLTVLKWNEGCGRGCVRDNQAEKCNFHVKDERICLPAHTRICSQCKAMNIRRKVKASKHFSFWLCSPRSNMANGARCVLSCHSGLEIKWIYKVRTLSWLQAARCCTWSHNAVPLHMFICGDSNFDVSRNFLASKK